MNTNSHVGVSGFSYPKWKGRFYPKEVDSAEFLAYYSQRLDSVEINSSFYSRPSASMVKNWAAKTSANFRFAVKAPKQITHILRLGSGSPDETNQLSTTLDLLGPRRGPVLFQLPPYSKLDLKLLEEFLSKTSGVKYRAFEFRHESWFRDATYQLLDRYRAGFCVAETEEMRTVARVTGGFAYFRLRKEAYDVNTVDQWAGRIRELAKGVPERYVYLRHDETGENALLAQRLSEKLRAGE